MISSGSNTSLESTSLELSSSLEDIVSSKGPLKVVLQWYDDGTDSSKGLSKALLQWYDDGTNEDIVKSPKKPTPTVIVKSPVPIKGCVLGLANVKT
ncbi:hypothetical protein Tco_1287784 [Tanacetum coccineum]|uniref:Uncharacterized protein n=1 Tax=Tanacetum coccineum TaxID=301880 RepID=A0ABQ5FGF3_9ASTR